MKNAKAQVIRLNGHLHEVIKQYDSKGKIYHTKVNPLHVEFKLRDMMQVIVGATVLAIPVGFTEEVWRLGSHLPWINIALLGLISMGFIALFIYYDSYRKHFQHFLTDYFTRVFLTYVFVLLVCGIILTIIDVAPWSTQPMLAIKRIVIVSFPASMSAAITDTIK